MWNINTHIDQVNNKMNLTMHMMSMAYATNKGTKQNKMTKTQPQRKYHIASPEKARVGVTNMESCIRGVTTLHHYKMISSRDLGWHRRETEEEEKR